MCFCCYSLIMRNHLQTKKCLAMIVDTWCFCLLTEPNCQPSNLLVREEESADLNAAALWSSALWSFPKKSISQDTEQMFFIAPPYNHTGFFQIGFCNSLCSQSGPRAAWSGFQQNLGAKLLWKAGQKYVTKLWVEHRTEKEKVKPMPLF